MTPADPEEGFKITDRRRRDEPEPPRPASPGPPPTTPVAHAGPEPSPGPLEDERSLVGLFMMLASSAVVALGEIPDPVTGQRHPDLGQAAEVIDLLLLLREKTEGRRSPDETQALEELIYDLQLRYVNVTKRVGSPPGQARS